MLQITERQYKLIIQQAIEAYPQETGGILGGQGNTIMAVLPIVNKEFLDPKKKYGLTGEDFERGHLFLQKHGMEFLGVYHTHPKGIAYPSEQDLSHKFRYLFIVGLRDQYNPEFAAYQVIGKAAIPEPIRVVSDKGFTVVDIATGKPKIGDNLPEKEMAELRQMIDDYLHHRLSYKKDIPVNWDSSTFSTRA
jgi:proteasome lid subunit RPN8/RPN11